MEHVIQSGLGPDDAGALECDDTVRYAKRPYVAPRLVVFGSLESLTLGNELDLGTDTLGFLS